jgi:hypothetical protein
MTLLTASFGESSRRRALGVSTHFLAPAAALALVTVVLPIVIFGSSIALIASERAGRTPRSR